MYVRMISKRNKWEENKDKEIDELSSDVITGCLRTSKETLSLWHIETDDEKEIERVIIALSSNRESIQMLDYIIIPDDCFEEYSLNIVQEKGNSPYEEFNANHYNITNLNYKKLGDFSTMVLKLISNGKGIQRFYKGDVKNLLVKAFKDGKLNIGELNKELRDKLVG